MAEITKSYEPRDVEKKWYAAWQEAHAFAGRVAEGKEPYTIVIPPPNVTGVLTMGHVLNNTLQDILIRRARLEGRGSILQRAWRDDQRHPRAPEANGEIAARSIRCIQGDA